ncbi:MAG: hypothetical protein GTN36_02945 [Candidatus Aenigmarchaeota archaeon]|nr:hypothetical protein [Candidatus Aenigmarchaeota archaeon]
MRATVLIKDVFQMVGVGVVPVGIVTKGVLKQGMKTNIEGKIMTVKFIEKQHQQTKEAHEGEKIGFSLKNAKKSLLLKFREQEVTFYEYEDEIPIISKESEKEEGFFSSLFK